MKKYSLIVCLALCFVGFQVSAQTPTDSTSAAKAMGDTAKVILDTAKVAAVPALPTDTTKVATEIKPAATDSTERQSDGKGPFFAAPAPAVTDSSAPLKNQAKPAGATVSTALKKANLLYGQQAYAEAIPYYEKAKKTDGQNKLILSNLANCYRLTNNLQGQLVCYAGLVNMGAAEPIQELYYGEALVQNGEPEKAKVFFEKYSGDTRGKEMAESVKHANEYTKNSDAYSLTPASFNSPQSDFAAVKFYDATVFVSNRQKISWIKTEHAWTDAGFLKVYATRKDGNGKDLKPILFMGDLNTKFNDGPVSFTKDFNTIYFTRNNVGKDDKSKDGLAKMSIMLAYLDENGFSEVEMLPFDNIQYNYTHPSISPDGYTLYFSSDMPGGQGGMDIYMVKRDSLGAWGQVSNLGDKVNTAGNEVFPYYSPDSVFYFSSDGHYGLGGLDIYETKIKNGKVVKIYNMGVPVNSKNDDFGLFINEDLKGGYVCSNRKAGDMDDDVYDLQILRKVKRGKDALLITKDKLSGEILDSVKVVINSDTVMTNEKGEYLLSVDEDLNYKLSITKTDYFPLEDTLSAGSSTEDSFQRELLIEKDPKLSLKALITDTKSNELLDSVTIRITDINTSFDFDPYLTGDSGVYQKALPEKKIGDKLAYLIRLEKSGYLQRTAIFSYEINQPGVIDVNKTLNLSLGKIEVGMDLAKMIEMKPIYFDLGKSSIRPDAATELDKIVQVMNEYPNMYIELGSHTDCRSSAKSNLKLSDERAKSSAAYIVKKGINKSRIVGKGYGESKLLNSCACEGKVQSTCTEDEHMQNRRTEFVITKLK